MYAWLLGISTKRNSTEALCGGLLSEHESDRGLMCCCCLFMVEGRSWNSTQSYQQSLMALMFVEICFTSLLLGNFL